MKRNLNENSTRSTAGCLPVPLFNQRKRTRQPLTSNPLQSDSGISTAADSYDFPPLPAGDNWAWEAANPELAPLMKPRSTSQIPHSVSHPLRSQESVSKFVQPDTDRGQSEWSYRGGNKTASLQTWGKNDTTSQCTRTNPMANDGNNFCPVNLGAQHQKQFKMSERPNLPHHRETQELRQMHSSKLSGSTAKGLGENSASQAFKPNLQQNQFKKKMLDDIPEKSTPKEASFQLHFKEKSNTLRIISAVIESMKYWREHVQKTVLLFEVLAVLDSAVTPGPHYSKTFLLRDGKHTVPCVFYEIDRELPRLIRGRVHRCVGNYDQKKNIFKCVSVRPASVSEQKTFQTFVKIADAEMRYYTKVMNEV